MVLRRSPPYKTRGWRRQHDSASPLLVSLKPQRLQMYAFFLCWFLFSVYSCAPAVCFADDRSDLRPGVLTASGYSTLLGSAVELEASPNTLFGDGEFYSIYWNGPTECNFKHDCGNINKQMARRYLNTRRKQNVINLEK